MSNEATRLQPNELTKRRKIPAQKRPRVTFLGVLGEIFITIGVVLGLFVVWQVYWTDFISIKEQAEIVADLGWEKPNEKIVTSEEANRKDYGEPPLVDTGEFTDIFATMYIPRFGADYERPIANGIDKKAILDKIGIGWYPDTQLPGQLGNFAVAGHRVTYGKPFNQVAEFEMGDAIVVRTEDAWFVYEVTEKRIVTPDQIEVISPVPGKDRSEIAPEEITGRYITLTACHPKYSLRERYIVHGEFKYWMPTSEGTPEELQGGL